MKKKRKKKRLMNKPKDEARSLRDGPLLRHLKKEIKGYLILVGLIFYITFLFMDWTLLLNWEVHALVVFLGIFLGSFRVVFLWIDFHTPNESSGSNLL